MSGFQCSKCASFNVQLDMYTTKLLCADCGAFSEVPKPPAEEEPKANPYSGRVAEDSDSIFKRIQELKAQKEKWIKGEPEVKEEEVPAQPDYGIYTGYEPLNYID